MKKFLALFLSCSLSAGCASFHRNPPLEVNISQAANAYSFNNFLATGNEIGDNLVILTFSGGGTRAGAFAYGVSRYLNTVKLPSGQSLLDETKIISSVSGGSFAAAYYGLYGKEKFLKDYPQQVLYENISSQLVHNLLRFKSWVPIAFSADLGKSDVAQAVYDNEIFHHKTFADMPRKWPFIIMNGTDMTKGTPFSFIQEDFNLLCSDLNGVPISRAVVTSSAFPGPFTPLGFKNYPKSKCGYEMPKWAQDALQKHPDENLQNYLWAQNLQSYFNTEKRKYVHLLDGGVADNLGLRSLLYHFRTSSWNVLDENRSFKAKRVIVVVVNAKPVDLEEADRVPKVPKFFSVLMNAATKPMSNYTTKTIEEFMMRFDETRKAGQNFELYSKLCDQTYSDKKDQEQCYDQFRFPFGEVQRPPYPDFYFVHVSFDAIQDKELQEQVGKIETDLQLPKAKVDLLIQAAADVLSNSPEFAKLKQDLNAQAEKAEVA